ncbi:hypothetical protein SEA_ADORA_13 [Gordonia phage Adora]|nr:hypothetical protein SEA_ADORA_13 [Gordonia phage Adora]
MAVPESDLFSGTASDLGGEPEPVGRSGGRGPGRRRRDRRAAVTRG